MVSLNDSCHARGVAERAASAKTSVLKPASRTGLNGVSLSFKTLPCPRQSAHAQP